jgi:hypothetical protein
MSFNNWQEQWQESEQLTQAPDTPHPPNAYTCCRQAVSNSMVVVVMGSWWRWHFMVNHGGDISPDALASWSV